MHPQFFEASITIALATSLAAYTLCFGQPGRARRIFVWLLGAIVLWSGGVAASHVATDAQPTLLAIRISFLGIFALPPAWYALGRHLTSRGGGDLSRRGLALITAPSLLFCGVMLTNDWHHLYMRRPEALATHGPLDWGGPAFWLWTGWAYLLVMAASIRYVSWSWRLVHEDARARGALIGLASVLPLSGNVAHVLGWTSGDHDLTPMLLGGATLMLFLADWRFRMLDTLPVARRDVIDHIRDGVIVANVEGVVLDLNPAACEMIGAPASELIGHRLTEVVAEVSPDRFDYDAERFDKTIRSMSRSAAVFESTIADRDGRHFEVRGSGVADQVGAVSGIYLIIREVTERRRLDQVRRESRRAHSIASLAAGIAHEVNNPLSYVRANVSHVMEVLGEQPSERAGVTAAKDETEELQAALADALEGVDRISTIVERVRQFTSTRGGARETIEIAPLVDEALRLYGPADVSSVMIEAEVADGLPTVIGVRDCLLESLANLLDNAQHALCERGGTIQLRARRVDHTIRIEVEDDGPGVTEDVREQIFEPFFSAGAHGFGAGLGLAITRKFIAELGGTLAHEPVDAGGARFVIELPCPRPSGPA